MSVSDMIFSKVAKNDKGHLQFSSDEFAKSNQERTTPEHGTIISNILQMKTYAISLTDTFSSNQLVHCELEQGYLLKGGNF